MSYRIASLAAVFGLLFLSTANADVIAFEDFDGGAINLSSTTNVFDYGAGGGSGASVFGRVSPFSAGGLGGPTGVWDDTVANNSGSGNDPMDTIGVAGQNTTAFFAMENADGVTAFSDVTWSFDISSASTISNIQIDIGARGNFETFETDGFLIEAQVDGGGYVEIFRARTVPGGMQTYRAFDNNVPHTISDPLELFIDGGPSTGLLDKSDAATGLFDTYTSTGLAGMSGSTLDIRISWAGTPSGSEPMAFDNIAINGNPLQSVVPEGKKLLDGVLAAGTLPDLFASDDQYYELDPAFTKNLIKQKIHLIVQSTSPTETPTDFRFRVESVMLGGPSGDVIQKIELFNYDTGFLELMDLRAVAITDESIEIIPAGDPTRFIQPITREITGHVTWTSDSFSGTPFNWCVDVDETVWRVAD